MATEICSNLFEIRGTYNAETKTVEDCKVHLNGQNLRNGWEQLLTAPNRFDVFVYYVNGHYIRTNVVSFKSVQDQCSFHPSVEYPILLTLLNGFVPVYTCTCNRLDNRHRDQDTVRLVDICSNTFVLETELSNLKDRFYQACEQIVRQNE